MTWWWWCPCVLDDCILPLQACPWSSREASATTRWSPLPRTSRARRTSRQGRECAWWRYLLFLRHAAEQQRTTAAAAAASVKKHTFLVAATVTKWFERGRYVGTYLVPPTWRVALFRLLHLMCGCACCGKKDIFVFRYARFLFMFMVYVFRAEKASNYSSLCDVTVAGCCDSGMYYMMWRCSLRPGVVYHS